MKPGKLTEIWAKKSDASTLQKTMAKATDGILTSLGKTVKTDLEALMAIEMVRTVMRHQIETMGGKAGVVVIDAEISRILNKAMKDNVIEG